MTRCTLDAIEFDVLWRSAGFGDPPLVLDVPSPGSTHAERRTVEATAWDRLVRRDLAHDHGNPVESLAEPLDLLAHPRRTVELRTGTVRALLARRGHRAALAELAGDRVRITTVAVIGVGATMVRLLPDLPAGAGHSVTVAAEVLARAEAADTPVRRTELLRRGLSLDEARLLVTMTGQVRGRGQFAAETRTRGAVRRADRVVAFFHNDTGRYQVLRRRTDDLDYVTVTPADGRRLTASVNDLLAELRA